MNAEQQATTGVEQKRAYESPVLTEYGDFRALTQAKGPGTYDGGSTNSKV